MWYHAILRLRCCIRGVHFHLAKQTDHLKLFRIKIFRSPAGIRFTSQIVQNFQRCLNLQHCDWLKLKIVTANNSSFSISNERQLLQENIIRTLTYRNVQCRYNRDFLLCVWVLQTNGRLCN